MYFLWKQTPYGTIKISGDGLADFINGALKSKFSLYSLSLLPSFSSSCSSSSLSLKPPKNPKNKSTKNKNEDANLTLALSSQCQYEKPQIKTKVENHLSALMRPMGILTSVVWVTPERSYAAFVQSSWTWAALASSAAIIVTAGWENFFWTAFWGAAAWFSAKGLAILGVFIEKRLKQK